LIIVVLTVQKAPGLKITELAPVEKPSSQQALVTFMTGEVYVYRNNEWLYMEIGELLIKDDILKVVENSFCELQFGEEAVIRLQENTVLEMNSIFHSEDATDIELDIMLGTVLCKVDELKEDEKFQVTTATTVLGVRGTEFLVNSSRIQTILAVRKGVVQVVRPQVDEEGLLVAANQQVKIDEKQAAVGALSEVTLANKNKLDTIDLIKKVAVRTEELVKVVVQVKPEDARIYLNRELVGLGIYSGIFYAGQELEFKIQKNGYREQVLQIEVEKGEDKIYPIELEVGDLQEEMEISGEEPDSQVLEAQLKAEKKEKQALQQSLEQKESDINDLNQQVSELKKTENSLRNKVENLQNDKADLEAEVERLKQGLSDLLDGGK
jgi:hypothetical protein